MCQPFQETNSRFHLTGETGSLVRLSKVKPWALGRMTPIRGSASTKKSLIGPKPRSWTNSWNQSLCKPSLFPLNYSLAPFSLPEGEWEREFKWESALILHDSEPELIINQWRLNKGRFERVLSLVMVLTTGQCQIWITRSIEQSSGNWRTRHGCSRKGCFVEWSSEWDFKGSFKKVSIFSRTLETVWYLIHP